MGALVKRDRSNYWLDVHLKMRPGQSHDLFRPVRLITSSGREIEPADTTLGGDGESGTTELWFKFWLETSDMQDTLSLRINDGVLSIKNSRGIPALGSSNQEYFPTHNW